MTVRALFFVFVLLLISSPLYADDVIVVGKSGNVYYIVEKDAYEEILEKVQERNVKEKVLALKSRITTHMVVNVPDLKKARSTNVRTVTLTYRLPFDIKDHNQKIIYPAGYTFNPLDYVVLPFVMVFFDATSSREIEWLKSSGYVNRWDVIFIAVKGNVYDAERFIGRTVFAGSKQVTDYFSVRKVPSVVFQKGNTLVVEEVGIYE